MRIPNADKAIIAPEKLRNYLLNPGHKRGSTKARVFAAFGYQADAWEILEKDLRTQHLSVDYSAAEQNPYGQRFEIRAPLHTPNGRTIICASIWQIDAGTDIPRFITMYPR